MSANPTTGDHICPNCGARNSAHSDFCAECGTSLTTNQPNDDRDAVDQTTISFTPVRDEPDRRTPSWDTTDTQATREFTPQSPVYDSTSNQAASTWEQPEAYAPFLASPPESRRGFVFGLIAAILIAIVIGFFIWSSLVGQGFRDSVTGLF